MKKTLIIGGAVALLAGGFAIAQTADQHAPRGDADADGRVSRAEFIVIAPAPACLTLGAVMAGVSTETGPNATSLSRRRRPRPKLASPRPTRMATAICRPRSAAPGVTRVARRGRNAGRRDARPGPPPPSED